MGVPTRIDGQQKRPGSGFKPPTWPRPRRSRPNGDVTPEFVACGTPGNHVASEEYPSSLRQHSSVPCRVFETPHTLTVSLPPNANLALGMSRVTSPAERHAT